MSAGDRTIRAVMTVKDGKFMGVCRSKGGLKLCAVDCQIGENNAPSLQIHIRERNQMALHFQHGTDSYFLKVDEERLMLEKAADVKSDSRPIPDQLSLHHWFEKFNLGSGEHYGLRSVVEPRKYLSTRRNKRRQWNFVLTKDSRYCALVRYETLQEPKTF